MMGKRVMSSWTRCSKWNWRRFKRRVRSCNPSRRGMRKKAHDATGYRHEKDKEESERFERSSPRRGVQAGCDDTFEEQEDEGESEPERVDVAPNLEGWLTHPGNFGHGRGAASAAAGQGRAAGARGTTEQQQDRQQGETEEERRSATQRGAALAHQQHDGAVKKNSPEKAG